MTSGRKDWQELYREAVLESDPEVIDTRIAAAQSAIGERRKKLWNRGERATYEVNKLEAASYFLELLKTTILRQQDPASPQVAVRRRPVALREGAA